MRTMHVIAILIFTVISSYGQDKSISKNTAKEVFKENKIRFTADSLMGVYIPRDIEDSFKQLDLLVNDSTKQIVKKLSEKEFLANAHLGFGTWLRNNWQLWAGSRLSKFFNDQGIYNAEDMSGILLTSYHRKLNHQTIKLHEQIEEYKVYWANLNKLEQEKKIKDFAGYAIGDTVLYKYPKGFSSNKQEKKYEDDVCIARGVVLEKNDIEFSLKVLLLNACANRGIVFYDNIDERIYNRKTNLWKKPTKRIRKTAHIGQSMWYNYNDWEIN